MKKGFLLMFSIFSSLSLFSCKPKGEVNFTIVETTDIHGMIFPYNFITDKEENTSMANICSYIKKLKSDGKTVLLLDNGDTLQGQPTVYYYNWFSNIINFPLREPYKTLKKN